MNQLGSGYRYVMPTSGAEQWVPHDGGTTPSASQVTACRPWLTRELEIVKPDLVVVMGSVAAKALLGPSFRVTQQRGQRLELPGGQAAVATVHPSAVVRSEEFRRDFARFVADLRVAVELLA